MRLIKYYYFCTLESIFVSNVSICSTSPLGLWHIVLLAPYLYPLLNYSLTLPLSRWKMPRTSPLLPSSPQPRAGGTEEPRGRADGEEPSGHGGQGLGLGTLIVTLWQATGRQRQVLHSHLTRNAAHINQHSYNYLINGSFHAWNLLPYFFGVSTNGINFLVDNK